VLDAILAIEDLVAVFTLELDEGASKLQVVAQLIQCVQLIAIVVEHRCWAYGVRPLSYRHLAQYRLALVLFLPLKLGLLLLTKRTGNRSEPWTLSIEVILEI